MSTLTTYRTAVQLRGYDALATATIDEAVQEARRRVITSRRWSWLESTTSSLVTVAGTSTVSLTSITTLGYIDAVRLALGTTPVELRYRTRDVIRDLQDRYADTGMPQFWTRIGSNIVLYPTPASVYTVTVEYIAQPADLAASPAVCVIPDRHRDLVTWAAVVPLAVRQRELQVSSAADQYFAKVLLPLHAGQDDVEQRQTSRQVRTGYWGS